MIGVLGALASVAIAVAAIAVALALLSWRAARRLARENAWIRRRLADERGVPWERLEAARRLRMIALDRAALGYDDAAKSYLRSADEVERGTS